MFFVLVLIAYTFMVTTASDKSEFLPIELKDCLSNRVLRFDFLGECNGHPNHYHGGLQEYKLVGVREIRHANETIIEYDFYDGCNEYRPSFQTEDGVLHLKFRRRLDEEETECRELDMKPFLPKDPHGYLTKYSSTLKVKKLDTTDIYTKDEITTAFPLSFLYAEKYNGTELRFFKQGVFLYPGQCIEFEGAVETSFKSAKIYWAHIDFQEMLKEVEIYYYIALYTYEDCQGDKPNYYVYPKNLHTNFAPLAPMIFTYEEIHKKKGVYAGLNDETETFGYALLPWSARKPEQMLVVAEGNEESNKGWSIVAVGCVVGVVLVVALTMFVFIKKNAQKENEYMQLS